MPLTVLNHQHGLLQPNARYIKYESLATPVSELIISFGIAAVVYFGGSQVLSERMTSFDFNRFHWSDGNAFQTVTKLQGSYSTLQRSAGAAERVFKLLDEPKKL
jgi:subfamily B ATP-binding cassette protein MsbA